jgi:hypothetical protein
MAESRSEEIERQFAELGLETEEQRSRFRMWAIPPDAGAGLDPDVPLFAVTNTSAAPAPGRYPSA